MDLSVNNKEDLLTLLSQHGNSIKSFGVKSVGLFGSFAKNTSIHNESDVDLLIDFENGQKTYDNFIELSFYLEKILNRKVELLTRQSLSKYSGYRILNEVEYVSI